MAEYTIGVIPGVEENKKSIRKIKIVKRQVAYLKIMEIAFSHNIKNLQRLDLQQ